MTPFDVTLKAKFTSTSMNGYWIKEYRGSRLPFTATHGKPRFKSDQESSLKIDSIWSITFRGSGGTTYPGVGIFKQEGNKITGTIMTEVSDFRYFEGILYGDSIKLTAFDGTHAFLFIGQWENEEWKGKIYFDKGYVEEWTARYDESASIQHPF